MASYEEQAYYIYELIENLEEGDNSTTRIIFDTFNLNKMHFEYLSQALLEFYEENQNGELIDIDNESIIMKINDSYVKIDVEVLQFNSNINQSLFRIQKENDLRKFEF
jgi:hypothetical protein